MSRADLLEAAARRVIYDPSTGTFIWKEKEGHSTAILRWNSRFAGKLAGGLDRRGYARISLLVGSRFYNVSSARLAWYVSYGKPPSHGVDHINGVRDDNRLCNLRDVPQRINNRNAAKRVDNTSGVVGVQWYKALQKWNATVVIDSHRIHLGYFFNKEEAAEVARNFRLANGFTGRCYSEGAIQ